MFNLKFFSKAFKLFKLKLSHLGKDEVNEKFL